MRGLDVHVCGGVQIHWQVQPDFQRPGPAFCTTRRGDSRGNSRYQMSESQPQTKYSTNFLILPIVFALSGAVGEDEARITENFSLL